jgi:GDP-4-dehydro-6-deoxy-D-mannose reductase
MGRALVTGGAGFVGTWLCRLLADAGWDVVALGRAERAEPGYVAVDLTRPDAAAGVLDAVRPDVVFHLAAASPQKESDPAALVAGAVGATQSLCVALRRVGGAARLVLAGSSAQYGAVPREQNPVTEETLGRPVGAYGFAKAAAEATACALAVDGAFELVAVRSFNHVGPGEPASTVAGAFAARVAAVMQGRADRVRAGDLEAVRDFTDVRDIAAGYLALAERGRPGRIYNLCSGRATGIGEVLDGLLAAAGLDRSIVDETPGPAAAAPGGTGAGAAGRGGVRYQVGSPARVAADTGWAARIPLATSLADLLNEHRLERRPSGV